MKTSFATVLKNKKFTKIWVSQTHSLVCAHMLNFVLMGKIFQITGSTVAVGLLWGFFIAPTIFLGPFVGVLLDYLDKRKVLIFSNLIQAVVILFFLGIKDSVWLIYSLLLHYSFLDEFVNPNVAILIPSLVKKKRLAAANSLYFFTSQGAFVIGFLSGGLMLKYVGFSHVIFISISCLLLVAALLASSLKWQEPEAPQKLKVTLNSLIQELLKGYRFIRDEPKVLSPMILLAGLQVVMGMGLILTPSISKTILKIDFADSSYLLVIPAVLGAIIGGILTDRISEKYLKRYLIIGGLSMLGLATFIFGLLLPYFFHPPLGGAALALFMGIAFIFMFIPLQILIQENTPFSIRGRVFSTLNAMITLATAAPVFFAVTLVDIVGVKLVLSITGLGMITLAFYAARGKYGIALSNHRS